MKGERYFQECFTEILRKNDDSLRRKHFVVGHTGYFGFDPNSDGKSFRALSKAYHVQISVLKSSSRVNTLDNRFGER